MGVFELLLKVLLKGGFGNVSKAPKRWSVLCHSTGVSIEMVENCNEWYKANVQPCEEALVVQAKKVLSRQSQSGI